MQQQEYDLIVVGGGPSGMMAAGRAGELGLHVLLIEKNRRLGEKLSITGGGRCNITNAESDNQLFLDNFPKAKRFLLSPFSQFNVDSTFSFFEDRGLKLKIEDRKRAFPKSESAEDVRRFMERYVAESENVHVRLGTAVKELVVEDGELVGVRTGSTTFCASKIVIATGGLAAPETGSTGEGISMLGSIGHKVAKPNPSLAPLKTPAKWVHKLSGTSINGCTLKLVQDGKAQHKVQGRLLFTHFGISGPMVINCSQKAQELLKQGPLFASIDLFPNEDVGNLDKRIQLFFDEHKNKQLKNVLKELVPARLSPTILGRLELASSDLAIHSVTKEQRKQLVGTLKDLSFPLSGTMGYEWSIVADGGVEPEEIQFKSMTSKHFPNLYLVGDTININRPSGGFSLQLCWTMGWVAGTHAAQ